jgi:hypothetical protein
METSGERKSRQNMKIEPVDRREFGHSGFVAERWNNTSMKKHLKPMKKAVHAQGTVFAFEKEF